MNEEKKAQKKRRQAVIVGINKYMDHPIIPDLEGAEKDAEEVKSRLTNPDLGDLAFDVSDDHYLTGNNATCANIRKAISDIFWESGEKLDIALFYFSGHGVDDGYGDGYIAPYDMFKSKPFVCGINLQELRHVFSNPFNKANIIILDACYSGIATKGDVTISDDVFKELGEGRFILASSGGDQTSKEVKLKHEIGGESHAHGAFSFYLIEGLDGKAADKDELISLASLYNYAEAELIKTTRNQKSKIYMADATGYSSLKISASRQRSENINNNIKRADELYKTGDLLDLIEAANIISEVLRTNGTNEIALEFKNKISKTALESRESVISWSLDYGASEDYKPIRRFFAELLNLTENLTDFDKIIKLNDNKKKAFLANLYKISRGQIEKSIFMALCKNYFSSPGKVVGIK